MISSSKRLLVYNVARNYKELIFFFYLPSRDIWTSGFTTVTRVSPLKHDFGLTAGLCAHCLVWLCIYTKRCLLLVKQSGVEFA